MLSGESERVQRNEVLLPDRQSAELAARARANNPSAVSTIALEYIEETLSHHADWVVDKIAPRPLLIITSDDDRLVPAKESRSLFDKAGELKKMVTFSGVGHYDVYTLPAFGEVMSETLAWFKHYLPARVAA